MIAMENLNFYEFHFPAHVKRETFDTIPDTSSKCPLSTYPNDDPGS